MIADKFIALRPFLYHLTDARNLPSIRSTRHLYSTELLVEMSDGDDGLKRLLYNKRNGLTEISVDGEVVIIRDQDPLYRGKMELTGGCSYEQFLKVLNERVFFWAGRDGWTVTSGRNHFERYASQDTIVIKVPTADLVSCLGDNELEVCRYNSGSPRFNGGKPGKRGHDTFSRLCDYGHAYSSIQEVTIRGMVELPETAKYTTNWDGQSFASLFS